MMGLRSGLGTGVNHLEDVISRLPGDLLVFGIGYKGVDGHSAEGAVRRIKERCPEQHFTEEGDKTTESGVARVELNLTQQHINRTHFEASDVSWRCLDMCLLICDMSRNQVSRRRQVCGKKSVDINCNVIIIVGISVEVSVVLDGILKENVTRNMNTYKLLVLRSLVNELLRSIQSFGEKCLRLPDNYSHKIRYIKLFYYS
jgi:hypothetical protein